MRDMNFWTSSHLDGTRRSNVPDLLVSMRATWIDNGNTRQDRSVERYMLVQFNWLITNHPKIAQKLAEDLVLEIEKVRQGVSRPETLA